MRYIKDVIDAMLLEVPTWEASLKKNLTWVKHEAEYVAPEAMKPLWAWVTLFLSKAISPKPLLPWHFKVLSIWMVKTEEELQEMFP